MQGMREQIAIVKGLCEEAGAEYQIYVNRSDIPGGSTVGLFLLLCCQCVPSMWAYHY